MLGSATKPRATSRENSFMLEDGLQDSERPAEALPHERVGTGRSLGEGERMVFVFRGIAVCVSGAMVRSAFRRRHLHG
jgi:hypothetical protein